MDLVRGVVEKTEPSTMYKFTRTMFAAAVAFAAGEVAKSVFDNQISDWLNFKSGPSK